MEGDVDYYKGGVLTTCSYLNLAVYFDTSFS